MFVLLISRGKHIFTLSLNKSVNASLCEGMGMQASPAAPSAPIEVLVQGLPGRWEESSPDYPVAPRIDQLGSLASESQLRDLLASNLPNLPGIGQLRPYQDDPSGRNGVEFCTPAGRIDLLTMTDEGEFCVLELKLHRGADRALGQLQRYMGWVQQHLAAGKRVYGVILAERIDEKLESAATQARNVSLFEYDHVQQLTIRPIGSDRLCGNEPVL